MDKDTYIKKLERRIHNQRANLRRLEETLIKSMDYRATPLRSMWWGTVKKQAKEIRLYLKGGLMEHDIEKGDIVQITDQAHAWFPCLLIVDEVKSWGVQAGCLCPQSNDAHQMPATAYNQLKWEQIERVGKAAFVAA